VLKLYSSRNAVKTIHVITQNLISDYTITYTTFRNDHIYFSFNILFNRNKTTFAAVSHVLWALNTSKMRLRSGLGRKRIFRVFRAKGTYLMAADFVLSPLDKASSAPNSLAEFEGPLQSGGETKAKSRKGGGRERQLLRCNRMQGNADSPPPISDSRQIVKMLGKGAQPLTGGLNHIVHCTVPHP